MTDRVDETPANLIAFVFGLTHRVSLGLIAARPSSERPHTHQGHLGLGPQHPDQIRRFREEPTPALG